MSYPLQKLFVTVQLRVDGAKLRLDNSQVFV